MPDLLLPRLKREIDARLAELRPLVAEAERLEAAKAALLAEAAARRGARPAARGRDAGAHANGSAPARAGSAARTAESAPSARNEVGTRSGRAEPAAAAPADEGTNGQAPRGGNQAAIIAIVEERPGVSVAEIASVTKIAKPTVATTVSKLKREGVLADEAGGVKLASRQPITLAHVAPTRDEGVSDKEWEAARKGAAA